MYKVGICGHFGVGKNFLNGQTIKTKILKEELDLKIGENNIVILDTYGWSKHKLRLFIDSIMLLKNSKNIIILPAQNGVKVFVPLFVLFNLLFKRRLHYVVIGGWLPELARKNKFLLKLLSKIDYIYVETNKMKEILEELNLNNIVHMPNFKKLNIIDEKDLVYNNIKPYKLCTFSRVMKEKGIEEIALAVDEVNEYLGEYAYKLDIYGQIDSGYQEEFNTLLDNSSENITYKGTIKFDESVEVLKNYFMLCFPTYYKGEGVAGTLIDALSSGLPVLASDWRYNEEVITNNIEGKIFKTMDREDLKNILVECYKNPHQIFDMKKACIKKSESYKSDVVISQFIKNLK